MKCGCKGVRFCQLCRESERVKGLKDQPEHCTKRFQDYKCFVFVEGTAFYCPNLNIRSSVGEITQDYYRLLKGGDGEEDKFTLSGITLIEDFLTEKEEEDIVDKIEATDWALSQSGRRKQDYGPRVNFNQKKVKCDRFVGVPDYADLVLNRLESVDVEKFGNYHPFELCNLEYTPDRQSHIDFHQDDIWGERLISLNLLDESVMTFENEENRSLVFVHMPRRSLLFFYGEARHRWKHGIFSWHIQNRRIALTMREPGQDFQKGGNLYERFGKELIERSSRRIEIRTPQTNQTLCDKDNI